MHCYNTITIFKTQHYYHLRATIHFDIDGHDRINQEINYSKILKVQFETLLQNIFAFYYIWIEGVGFYNNVSRKELEEEEHCMVVLDMTFRVLFWKGYIELRM